MRSNFVSGNGYRQAFLRNPEQTQLLVIVAALSESVDVDTLRLLSRPASDGRRRRGCVLLQLQIYLQRHSSLADRREGSFRMIPCEEQQADHKALAIEAVE